MKSCVTPTNDLRVGAGPWQQRSRVDEGVLTTDVEGFL